MIDEKKLKPCPFCGGEVYTYTDEDWYWKWKVECQGCGCDLGYYETEAEATEAWNKRVEPPADQCVPLSEVYRVIAGHSDYHGDNILAALTCIAEGKEVEPVRSLPADQWIPCSERLPEDEQDVIGTTDEGIAEKVWYNKHSKTWYGSPFTRRKTVTAWMPLPEPYKGVK